MALTFVTFTLAALLQFSPEPVSGAALSGHGHLHNHYAHHLAKRAAAVSTTKIPSGWASMGCYTDDTGARTLYSDTITSQTMTEEYCISYCGSNGYPFAGVEYSGECFCGRTVSTKAQQAADADCNMACSGDPTEVCGGPNRINLFKNSTYVAPVAGPATNIGPPDWGFLGCYVDSVQNRTLPAVANTPGGYGAQTVALCTQACQQSGYLYAGLEYHRECYCGNVLPDSYLAPDGLAGCNMVCNGNSSEFCGGANRLDVYGFGQRSTIAPRWANLGCYSDSVQSRTFRYQVGVVGGYTNMTVENCQNACNAQGYPLSGVEYGQECWCDSAYNNGGAPASDGCTMPCKGDNTETCGGPNRLGVYSFIGGPASTATTTTPAATTIATATATDSTTAITTTTSSIVTPTGIPANWTYSGCYVDNANGRILNQQTDTPSQTVETCIATCQKLGLSIAGVQYSTQCFCGSFVSNGGVIAKADTECAMSCGGNANEICGGPNRMSIYASGNFSSYPVPTPQNTSLPGNFAYKGCLADGAQSRVLPYQIDSPGFLNITGCLSQCQKFGYSAAGLEYGSQCFCGDDTDRINSGAAYLTGNQCNMVCPGQPGALCGGSNALTYYSSPPLQTWGQATGDAAGQYQFLIGGVVIPLITQVGVNNKVMFVEKHGTGPKNSTGAFELDLSQINNFTAAWRTMNGIKTDVFCSAGLTLPDKAGRMINIGGWSADSLYGVRFYWPDGSPGVPGQHDWEENVQEVGLQDGRWYPSAMQMVNGSILVVGGEDGSNGKPVPTLEVIPRPAQGRSLYMQWLKDTDPLNLYPFLTVLPTGDIAVFYYNEARILSEHDFSTVRTLPNIPGAVNRPDGGRTYPLEGTAMLFPQSAPYTDPLTVLICGGSTPYQGFALDNCVSIQPEDPSSQWTIERMPDTRVISCMTALPDGTFMILNGAHQGQAGFGLASDANHMAVLYDPTKPLNQRMTRMANTTIDRLYHSEAILLPDGRILVSGSDPEDKTHEQEYRVEVFVPPYLMGGRDATRPTYTIDNNHTDWAYGESVTISVQGSVGKVSLMGAVSSTHGNSMGQRTLHPSFSCSGGKCTIQSPPNGHITGGPGWFMLFVLDTTGTPSISQWVRIGGDPAGLGNWPNFPDFSLPGV